MTIMEEISYLNLTVVERRVLQTTQAVLTGIAVILNVLYLIVIKANSGRLNATEVLQTCKTFLVLLSLLICMPLELIVVNGIKKNSLSLCLFKDVTERVMLDVYPFVIMAVAITRFRVIFCKGKSAVLITRTSAIVTFTVSLVPTFLSGSLMLALYHYNDMFQYNHTIDNQEEQIFYECRTDMNTMVKTCNVVVLIVFGIAPVLVTLYTYYWIYHKVSVSRSKTSIRSARRISRRSVSFFSSPHDSNIKITMFLLITIFTISWFFYIFFAIFRIYYPFRVISFCLILSKPLIYVIHPLAEGLFLQHKRYKLGKFFSKITSCKQVKENNKETSRVEVQIGLSLIRHPSESQVLSAVQEETIETIPMTSYHQNSYTSLTIDPFIEEEELLKGITPSPCLHGRRTGQPMPPLPTILENVGRIEDDSEVCKSQGVQSPKYRRRCKSHDIYDTTKSPFRKRASSHASCMVHHAAIHSSTVMDDLMGVVFTTNKTKAPKSS